jgi:hypothetical protein
VLTGGAVQEHLDEYLANRDLPAERASGNKLAKKDLEMLGLDEDGELLPEWWADDESSGQGSDGGNEENDDGRHGRNSGSDDDSVGRNRSGEQASREDGGGGEESGPDVANGKRSEAVGEGQGTAEGSLSDAVVNEESM